MPRSKVPDRLAAVVLLVCAVVGCKQFQKLAQPTVLKSPDGKYELTVPAGWRESALSSEQAEIKAGNPLAEMYVLVLTEEKADFTDETTLDDYTNIVRDAMAANLEGPDSSPPLPVMINGNPGRQYEIQGATKNVKLAYIVTTVETAEQFHQIVTWTLRSRIDKNQTTLQKVTQSFRSTPSPGAPPK